MPADDTAMDMGCLDEDMDMSTMLIQLGAPAKGYQRERNKAYNRIVSEIYSPPRVARMVESMPELKLIPGMALDLTCIDPDDNVPWDFNAKEKREKAFRLIRQQKPMLLIGSPMCTAWSTWQFINDLRRTPEERMRLKVEARVHLEFVAQLYQEQVQGGRYFLHEHPANATSWDEKSIKEVSELPGVNIVRADQCQFGQQVNFGKYKGAPIKKETGFMSNSDKVLDQLRRRCLGKGGKCSRPGGGTHASCSGRAAQDAARYPPELCKAILRGISEQLHEIGMLTKGCMGVQAAVDEREDVNKLADVDKRYSGKYRDDLSGQVLRDDLVEAARALELAYFEQKGVWRKRLMAEVRRQGKIPITVRWVDVNKGDDLNPRYRSRLVARQLKAADRSGTSYFAPTPPLESLRTILSFASSTIGRWKPCYSPSSSRRMQISCVDVARAYFNAKTDPTDQLYVRLPPEHPDHGSHVGELVRHMYGTRPAADGWQEEYSSFLVSQLKFRQGKATPCVFVHEKRQIVVSVHGDDFTAAGAKEELDWYEGEIQKHYEVTIQPRLGPGPEDSKEAIVLNRVIKWSKEGVSYEADPRQAEKLLIECNMDGVNPVSTPGVRASFQETETDAPLNPKLATPFRAAAARANYLAADRPDCQFAAKEICRWMSKPSEAAWAALKRLCRFLVGLPRLVYRYDFQEVNFVDVYTDTDWAGCPRTRKSTSGGCIMLNGHSIKTWSSTQTSVALSSGEAEFAGVVRGAGIGLGYCSLLADLGVSLPMRLWTDSSAAIGICSRQGLGKLRHLDTHTLWVQQAVRCRRFQLRKIPGESNPADLLTKHSQTRDRLNKLVRLQGCVYTGGRAESAALTRTEGLQKDLGRNDPAMAILPSILIDPVMPHRVFGAKELDQHYPQVEVPEGVELEETEGHDDPMLTAGAPVISDIIRRAGDDGLLRREK